MSSMSTVSSAKTVADIKELLNQILLSLPSLSLIRFKTVSKHWLSFISDPDFHRRHTLQNPNPKISAFFSRLIQERYFQSIPLTLTFPSGNPIAITLDGYAPVDSQLTILQSCNGLFLCQTKNFREKQFIDVYVVNPTTNKFQALSSAPILEKDQARFKYECYALAFDPSISPHYKVICVTTLDEYPGDSPRYHQIDIYSSETRAWGNHLKFPFIDSLWDFDNGNQEGAVYCNGAVHWISNANYGNVSLDMFLDGTEEFVREEWDLLHYFDFNEECMRVAGGSPPVTSCINNADIPLQGNEEGLTIPHLIHRCFGESSGRLYLIETYKYYCESQLLDVMEMEKDYSGWTVKYYVDLYPLVGLVQTLPRYYMNAFVVLGLFPDEKRDDEDDLWLHIPGKVISYNPRSNTIKKTIVELVDKNYFLSLDHVNGHWINGIFAYMESLASV